MNKIIFTSINFNKPEKVGGASVLSIVGVDIEKHQCLETLLDKILTV